MKMNCYDMCDNFRGLTPAELSAWEGRFDEAERVMGAAASDALKKLYNYYGKDFIVWLAKLYDPNTGCFYYSNSARDNEGFLPDCESTAQTLYMFRFTGMLSRYGRNFAKAFPPKMVSRCLAYLKSLQSPEDGYFYHPQWGKNISVSRRGRDFAQCIEIIEEMGGKPTYPTATERLEATSAYDADSRTEMPIHLRSRENMKDWLDDLKYQCTDQSNGMFNSYSFGHILSSAVQGGQVKAAGLLDFVCDYLDELQDPETGFWETGATYNSVSGVIKIGGVYTANGRVMNYAEKIIESCINVILSDEDTLHMCLVFNPHGALRVAINALVEINKEYAKRGEPEPYDVAAMRRIIYAKFPMIVERTIEKLNKFRCPDGSFSYYQEHCAPITQNVTVAKRCKEGDVNATICASLYPLNAIFGYLGISVVPMANAADFEIIRGIINDAKPILKIPKEIPYLQNEDFLSHAISWRSEHIGKHRAEITYDPIRQNNRVCKWTVNEGLHSSYAFNGKEFLNPPSEITCFEFECEFLLSSVPSHGDVYTLTIESDENEVAYTAVLCIEDGTVVLYDTGEYGNPACTDRIATLGRVGDWIRLAIFYYPEENGAKIKIYRDGVCVKASENYNGSLYLNAEHIKYATKGRFTNLCDDRSVMFIDSLKTRLYTDKYLV